ncbi:MAG: hypothetical protein ACR2JQ_08135, partial [Mycobacteriales bacterium]
MSAFDVWAPNADRVRIRLTGGELAEPAELEMARADDGWWHLDAPDGTPGTDYAFLLG